MKGNPFIISTHDLGRSPGSHRCYPLSVPAPADLGTGIIGVPVGTELALEVVLTAVSEGVLVQLTGEVPLVGECVRCLGEIREQFQLSASEVFFNPGTQEAARRLGDENADEIMELAGESVDVEPLLRDAVVLELPFDPVCTPECRGLCAECGEKWADLPPDHHHEVIDPRWSALAALATPSTKDDA